MFFITNIIFNSFQNCYMDTNPKVVLLDGYQMPLIGFGTMNIKPNDKNFNLTDFLVNALNIGYTHFDLAKFFDNEVQIGDSFKTIFEMKKPVLNQQDGQPIPGEFEPSFLRENLFFSLKVYNIKGKNLVDQVKNSLANLKLTYVDLLILDYTWSPSISSPILEGQQSQVKPVQQLNHLSVKQAWQNMQKCRDLELCRSIGVSNFSIQALLNLVPFTKSVPVINQVESHCYLTQKKMHLFCKRNKIVLGAYSPLARCGKDQKVLLGDKVDLSSEPILKALTERYSKTIHQILLNYQITRGVAVVPKTQRLDHLKDNFNITDFEMVPEDIEKLQSLNANGKIKVYQPKNLPFWKGLDPLC